MLSESNFDDHELTEAFYSEVFNRFYHACNSSIQELLYDCAFGLAPSPTGIQTFFIIAPNQDIADELIHRVDRIIEQVTKVMAGIYKTAICFVPQGSQAINLSEIKDASQSSYQYMIGKVFSITSEAEAN